MVVCSLPCLVKHSNERQHAAGTLYKLDTHPPEATLPYFSTGNHTNTA